jgi:hypothetical protein
MKNMDMKKMDEKMSMGRYWVYLGIAILSLVGLTLFLSSCEKEALLEMNGNIKINFTVGNSSYGAEEAVMRSAEWQPVVETVDALGVDGLYVSATLEEDERALLRSEPVLESIAEGVVMRIVVYTTSGVYVSHGKYKVKNATGAIESVGQGVSVPSAGTYRFVAYSENRNASSLMDNIAGNVASFNFAGAPASNFGIDFLCGMQECEVSGDVENNINIQLKHMGSRVKVKVSSAEWAGDKTFNKVPNVYYITYPHNLKFTVFSGVLEHASSVTINTSVNTSANDWETSTNAITSKITNIIFPFDAGFSVWVQEIRIGGYFYAQTVPVKFTATLQPGHSYTITLSLKRRNLVFAGSNIYWKDVPDDQDPDYPGYLTFESQETATADMKRYQGVSFQWGSLVGVSLKGPWGSSTYSARTFSPSSTVIYVPDYDVSGTPPTSSWRPSTAEDEGWSTWLALPRLTETVSTTNRYDTYLNDDVHNTPEYWSNKTGDICRYISENGHGPANDTRKWRMPVSFEMGAARINQPQLGDIGWVRSPEVGGGYDTYPQGEDGGATPWNWYMSHTATGLVFPSSGFRYTNDGVKYSDPGGYYWSASPYNTYAYYAQWTIGLWEPTQSNYRYVGMSVRCIVDNE